jgi:hypothetical protein
MKQPSTALGRSLAVGMTKAAEQRANTVAGQYALMHDQTVSVNIIKALGETLRYLILLWSHFLSVLLLCSFLSLKPLILFHVSNTSVAYSIIGNLPSQRCLFFLVLYF